MSNAIFQYTFNNVVYWIKSKKLCIANWLWPFVGSYFCALGMCFVFHPANCLHIYKWKIFSVYLKDKLEAPGYQPSGSLLLYCWIIHTFDLQPRTTTKAQRSVLALPGAQKIGRLWVMTLKVRRFGSNVHLPSPLRSEINSSVSVIPPKSRIFSISLSHILSLSLELLFIPQ